MTKKKHTATQVQMLPMSAVEVNAGQLEGLPANPREIRDEKFEKLKTNIQKYPELLEYRSLMVYPMPNGKHIIIGGNMRYRAMQELGYTEVPCVIIPAETPVEKLGAYTILDNNGFGKWDWDLLANEWTDWNMEDLGLDWDFAGFGEDNAEEKEKKETEKLSEMEYNTIYYDASRTDKDLADCADLEKFKAKVSFIDSLDLSEERKAVLRLFAYRFIKIDFEAVADYYTFRATEEEKKGIERLRCVIIDNGQLGGFVEDRLVRCTEITNTVSHD